MELVTFIDDVTVHVDSYLKTLRCNYDEYFLELKEFLQDDYEYALYVKNYPVKEVLKERHLKGISEITLSDSKAQDIFQAAENSEVKQTPFRYVTAWKMFAGLIIELMTYRHFMIKFLKLQWCNLTNNDIGREMESFSEIDSPAVIYLEQLLNQVGLKTALIRSLESLKDMSKYGLLFDTKFFEENLGLRCLICKGHDAPLATKVECFCSTSPIYYDSSEAREIMRIMDGYNVEAISTNNTEILTELIGKIKNDEK